MNLMCHLEITTERYLNLGLQPLVLKKAEISHKNPEEILRIHGWRTASCRCEGPKCKL